MTTPSPRFFRAAEEFREWLAKYHATKSELLVGFHKKATGKTTLTYQEALDEALVIGWIDGVRRRIDDESYSIRFSPRQPRSIWSNVNIARVKELLSTGRMRPEGLAVFERRDEKRAGSYSYERAHASFSPEESTTFAADEKALTFFSAQPPSYRRVATHWVVSAKKPETRARRLATLMNHSRNGERIPPLAAARKPATS